MRKSTVIALTIAASLGLSACSEKTQDNAAKTADSVGDDVKSVGVVASDVAADGAKAVGEAAKDTSKAIGKAADKAAASTDELGRKAENERAKIEADAHNESVTEAKKD